MLLDGLVCSIVGYFKARLKIYVFRQAFLDFQFFSFFDF